VIETRRFIQTLLFVAEIDLGVQEAPFIGDTIVR